MKRIPYVALPLAVAFLFSEPLVPTRSQEKIDNVITITRKFGWKEPEPFNTHKWQFSQNLVADETDGTVRVAKSVLVTHEMGATDFHQTETLSDSVQASAEFQLQKEYVGEPEIFIFGAPKEVSVNGWKPEKVARLESTGWTRVRFLLPWHQNGKVRVDMSGGGQILFEPTDRRPRSRRAPGLGIEQKTPGEYLIRLRVSGYVGEESCGGYVVSPVIDLWQDTPNSASVSGEVKSISFPDTFGPADSHKKVLVASVRTGPTPQSDESTWTRWKPSWGKDDEGEKRHRFAQFKFGLATNDPSETPRVPAEFEVKWELHHSAADSKQNAVSILASGIRPVEASIPFTYQPPSPRLKYLRDRYQLDKVIAAGKTEMEQLMLLRHWVRHQWHTAWGNHPAAWMPPWDAHIILESKDQPDCLTMCTHYACVFTQCCLALGFNARHCILDHHCVAEVFVNDLNKWVMMDAGNSAQRADVNLHFEKNGVPMSALELHNAYHDSLKGKKLEGITVHFTPKRLMDAIASMCRPDPKAQADRPEKIPLDELPKYPVCGIQNYRRYAFPGRNDYLRSLLPGELYQGWSEYFYDGYWWVGDSRDDPKLSPEYSKHLPPSRPQDIDWSLNWTKPHLARTNNNGELQVDLETFTPNLARLEMKLAEADGWKPTPAAFVWKLKPGKNTLHVRSVNQFERVGVPNKVEVEWKPDGQ